MAKRFRLRLCTTIKPPSLAVLSLTVAVSKGAGDETNGGVMTTLVRVAKVGPGLLAEVVSGGAKVETEGTVAGIEAEGVGEK